uniref:OSIGBa0159F11.9 protein n=1 Tax=Oryza sativa TaxID=4530 RepID=Q01IQ5_ORYSA|nr:OSIGBa0159F11.9 [Oryza sativa]
MAESRIFGGLKPTKSRLLGPTIRGPPPNGAATHAPRRILFSFSFSPESQWLGQSSTRACLPPLRSPCLPAPSAASPAYPRLASSAASASAPARLRSRITLPGGRSPLPPMDPAASAAESSSLSSRDVAAMPDSPPRRAARHRRAQSEILLGAALPDDIAFDADLGVVGEVGGGGGDDYEEEEEDDEEEEMEGAGGSRMFEMFLEAGGKLETPEPAAPLPPPLARPRHQHSMSMDGSTSLASSAAGVAGRMGADAKKAISDAKLAELALVDPKRAKRILANRQSAARSKERKMRYIAELERKVQTLQTEATTLSAQLSMLQRDTTGLTSENSDLKIRVQTMEQQVRLQDALNDRLRDEIQQLKVATGQVNANCGKVGNFGLSSFGGANPQGYQRSHIQSLLAAQQLQQLQIHSQHQQQQMHLQQHHHLSTVQQQLLQEGLPLPGDLKMKGIVAASHAQNAGASESHALRSEP